MSGSVATVIIPCMYVKSKAKVYVLQLGLKEFMVAKSLVRLTKAQEGSAPTRVGTEMNLHIPEWKAKQLGLM